MIKSMRSMFFVFMFLAVLLNGCSPVPSPVPPTPTSTLTPVPPTFTPEPTATVTPLPSPTLEPTVVPTTVVLPQQWNGLYTYPSSGQKQNIVLLIEKMDGKTFTGKMIWQPGENSLGAILRMNGEYITDFGDAAEQVRWGNLEDYKNEDKSGTWLKWTETEVITGRNYTTNGWYYAHIREDGTMVAIYYFNDTETVADSGEFVFKQATP